MGNLTDDMTRLRGEVDALRRTRGALLRELTRGASDLTAAVMAMRADFTAAHTAMAKKTGEERDGFVASMISEVNSLLGSFSRDRDDMARKGRRDRGIFLTEMRKHVTGMRKETADDMMGARLAWRGQRHRKSRPVHLKSVHVEKEPENIKPAPPPMEETVKKTVTAPAFKADKPLVPLRKSRPKKERIKKDAMPEVQIKKATDPLTEAKRSGTSAVEPDKVSAPATAVDKMMFQKSTEKSRLDEKPAKTTTRGKRGKK